MRMAAQDDGMGVLGKGKGKNANFPKYEFGSIYQYQIPEPENEENAPWKLDPAVPPADLKPSILSVVASVSLGQTLDLDKIAEKGINLHYNPDSFTPLVMRLRYPTATAMLFKSGKMVITGTQSVQECETAARRFARRIQKMNIRVSVAGLQIQNITATCNLGFRVRVDYLGRDKLIPETQYHPELFTGVSIPLTDPKAKVMVFRTGSILITGVRSEEDLDKAFRIIYPHVKLYAN